MYKFVVFLSLLWLSATCAAQHLLFIDAAQRYQLRPELLKSIAQMESRMHPWAVNLNWEGFKPRSKDDAVALIKAAQSKPWLLRLDYADTNEKRSHRLFFRSQKDANAALDNIKANATLLGINRPQDWEIRQLDTRSVDIGLMQINWKFHGRHFESPEALFEPKTNVLYAAKYLRTLLKRHGSTEKAVAFYHSNTLQYQAKYLTLFRPIYQKQLLLARR
jgi:soluble lytic murein transglycosylase-like protein